MRERNCGNLEFLGFELDDELNENCYAEEKKIFSGTVAADVHVIPTNEEIVIARSAYDLIQEGA